MFYAHFVLSKKGPLAKIWLAAHWDKKLTKAHVFETNIEGSVEAIIQPKAKLALRTSGHLLLGVVRIYSRKAKYLLADCNEAFVKIKMAFRPGMVDLPEENREAALSAITLPEAFHEFDTAMADLSELEVQSHQFAVNQSRPEEITMREDLGSITLIGDDGFGDMGFDGGLLDDPQFEASLFSKEPTDFATLAMLAMKENQQKEQQCQEEADEAGGGATHLIDNHQDEEEDHYGPAGADDDDYDSNDGEHDSPAGDPELFSDTFGHDGDPPANEGATDGGIGLFEDPVMPEEEDNTTMNDSNNIINNNNINNNNDITDPQPLSDDVQPLTNHQSIDLPEGNGDYTMDPPMPQLDMEAPLSNHINSPIDQPHNQPETFTLKPIDVISIGHERKYRKKRKLVVDEQKAIASETMKLQLSDTSDIITTLDLAPPTKKLMHWKETGGVEKLTIFPGRSITSKKLFKLFSSNLLMKQAIEKLQDTTSHEPQQQPSGQKPELKRSDEIEVRNTIGADGMPRLVFAVKKHLIPPPSSSAADDQISDEPPTKIRSTSSSSPPSHLHNGDDNYIDNSTLLNADDTLPPINADDTLPPTNDTITSSSSLHPQHANPSVDSSNTTSNDGRDVNFAHPDVTNSLNDVTNVDISVTNNTNLLLNDTNTTTTTTTTNNNNYNNNNIDDNTNINNVSDENYSKMTNSYNEANNDDDYDDNDVGGGYDDGDDDYDYATHNDNTDNNDNNETDKELPPHISDDDNDDQPNDDADDDGLLEPAEGEATEEAEERRWNKRSQQMLTTLKRLLNKKEQVSFKDTISKCNRKQVASKFYSLLVLKKTQTIDVKQNEPFSDIILTKGILYSAA